MLMTANTFVSIISSCQGMETAPKEIHIQINTYSKNCKQTAVQTCKQLTCIEAIVEGRILGVDRDAFDSRELFNVQNILGIDGMRIRNEWRFFFAGFHTAPINI